MNKLEELKNYVAELFIAATDKTTIEKSAVVNQKIEEIQAEQDIIQNIETTKVGEVAKEEPAVVEEKTAPVFAGADTNGNGPVLQTVSGVPEEENTFFEETRFEAKPSLWQRIKNSKFVQTIKYILSIKVVLEYPALPEGRGEF